MANATQKKETDPIRVLLVDDESDFRSTAAKRLGRRGLEIGQSDSGEGCLDLLATDPFQIVVLDVKMPGMGGIEALGHIKERFPETEVILLTGHSSAEDGVEGIKKGAFDYLSKPVEFDHLLEKIRQAHDRRRRIEEKRTELEFRAKMEQQMIATERLAALGTLSTGVAHEINNPLAMMRESAGYMRLFLNKPEASGIPGQKELARGLDVIEKGIDRIRRITHLLLGYARDQESMVAEIRLTDIIEETLELVLKEAKGKDIKFVRDTAEPVPVIWSDPYRIRQVLVNLLTNGVQAIKDDGIITVSLSEQKDGISLTVNDSGEGIPKENMSRIFEPFFTTKPPDKGTGLGLYVSRGIVNKLGGDIAVKSGVGKGTSFTVTLPKRHPGAVLCKENEDMCDDILKKIKEMNHNDPHTRKSFDR